MNSRYFSLCKKNAGAARNVTGILLLWALMVCGKTASGQNIFANGQLNDTTGPGGSVTAAGNAVNTTYTDSCRLSAASVIGTSTAYLQLIFGTGSLPANATVYIKYKSTGSLLGGGISVQAYSGSASPSTVGSTVATTSQDIVAPDGSRYLAVSASSSFNAVRFTLSSPVALGTNTADIFFRPLYTSRNRLPAAHSCCYYFNGSDIGNDRQPQQCH